MRSRSKPTTALPSLSLGTAAARALACLPALVLAAPLVTVLLCALALCGLHLVSGHGGQGGFGGSSGSDGSTLLQAARAAPGALAVAVGLLALASAVVAAAVWLCVSRPLLRHLEEADQRLMNQGRTDPLTGALNREGLHLSLQTALQRYGQRPKTVGVVMIDFDRFHLINDTLGQAVGDEVLRIAAERMRAVLRGRDVLARLTADRFAVQVTGTAGEPALAMLGRNLLRAFEPACSVAGRGMVLSPSIGTATAHQSPAPDELLKAAELALRATKAAGGGGCRHFEPSLMEQDDRRMDIEHRLRSALQTARQTPVFTLAFQPIVDAQEEHFVAVEALLRWPEPNRRQTPPAEFVPVLEQTGLIVQVGRWVLQEACRQATRWLSQGAHGLVLSVNVSPRQFIEPDFADTVAAVLMQTGFPANRLQLEVTEGLLLDASADVLRKLHALEQQGVRLAVDDFGIGQSSLAYLKTFPLHTLKIDRMFVRDLHQPGHDQARERAIARAIIELGHSLGLKVTAEGVETAEQAHTLKALGCDNLQGYLFGRPVPASMFTQWLARRAAPHAGAKPSQDWSDTMAGLEHPA